MVLRDSIKMSDSEKIFGKAYNNSIIDIVMLLIKNIYIYKNRQKGKVTNMAGIKYELSVQFQYAQYNAEMQGKLPIFEQNGQIVIHISR